MIKKVPLAAAVKTPVDLEHDAIRALQRTRIAHGWDVAYMANMIELDVDKYEKVELGERRLTMREFIKACLALQTHPKFFFAELKESDFGGGSNTTADTLHEDTRVLR